MARNKKKTSPQRPAPAEQKVPPKLLRYEVMYRDLRARGIDPDGSPLPPPTPADEPAAVLPAAPVQEIQPAILAPGRTTALQGKRIPDSLPVLQAFQEFLEVERSRTRNKLISLGFLFLLIVILVAGLSFFLTYSFYHRASRDIDDVRRTLGVTKGETLAANARLLDTVSAYTQQTDRVREAIDRDRASILQMQAAFTSRTDLAEQSLDNMRNSMSMMELQNAALRRNLEEALSLWRNITPPTLPDANELAAHSTLVVAITPPNAKEPVALRLPIPE